MMNAILRITLLHLLLFLIGFTNLHAQNCAPSFTHIKRQKEVHFSNTSSPVSGLEKFYWDFGDGSPLQKNIPGSPTVHFYTGNTGTFIVTLYDSLCPTYKRATDTISVSYAQIFQPKFTYVVLGNGQLAFYDISLPSSAITSYNWDFGDHHSDNTKNPVHTYARNGAYKVCLSVGDNDNNFDYTCDTVWVNDATNCKADFITQYVNGQFEFYNYSTAQDTSVNYLWKFGDGNTSSSKDPIHRYSQKGIYDVTLILQSNGCLASITKSTEVPDTNTCNLTLKQVVNNQRVQFILFDKTQAQFPQYFIEYGDGQSETISGNVTEHIYHTLGKYPVFVSTVGSSCGMELKVRDTVTVSSEIAICKANFEATSQNYAISLYNSSYVYGSNRNSTVTINWGDGNIYTGIDSVNYFHTYTAEGIYPISLRLDNPGGCSDSITKVFGVGPSYKLSGTISAGGSFGSFATLVIYAYEPLTGSLNSYGNVSANYDGTYSIDLPKGYYLIQADFTFKPDNTPFYLPTYYPNKLHWNEGAVITLNTNRSNINIDLNPFVYTENGGGNISGKIIYAAGVGNENGQIPPGAPVNKTLVFLLNDRDEIIAFTHSNAEGLFDFGKLPIGTYKVWPELAGKITTPILATLTEAKSSIGDVIILVGKYKVSTAVETTDFTKNTVTAYPNPTAGKLILKSSRTLIEKAVIFDNLGKIVMHVDTKPTSEWELDITALLNGFYYLEIINTDGSPDTVKFMKSTE